MIESNMILLIMLLIRFCSCYRTAKPKKKKKTQWHCTFNCKCLVVLLLLFLFFTPRQNSKQTRKIMVHKLKRKRYLLTFLTVVSQLRIVQEFWRQISNVLQIFRENLFCRTLSVTASLEYFYIKIFMNIYSEFSSYL